MTATAIRNLSDVTDQYGVWARWGMSERHVAHLPATDPPWMGGSLCGQSGGGWHPLSRLSLHWPWRKCGRCIAKAEE